MTDEALLHYNPRRHCVSPKPAVGRKLESHDGATATESHNMNAPEWGEAETKSLRLLWDEGVSTPEIGRRLGRSKNSVIGRVHRLGLPARPSPIIRDGEPHPYRRRRVLLSPSTLPTLLSLFDDLVPTLLPLLDDPILLTTPPRERPTPKPKPVVEVLPVVRQSKRRCDWLDGDKPFIRCCGMAQFGKPYCLAHHKIAYRRLHDLRDEAA